MFELKRALDWITVFFTGPIARGWVIVAFLCIAVGFGGYAVQLSRQTDEHSALVKVTQRLSKDERLACVVQNNSLPEGAEIRAIFDGMDQLIVLPQTEASTQLTVKLFGRKQYEHQQQLIQQLHHDLSVFRTTVSKEPPSRHCEF